MAGEVVFVDERLYLRRFGIAPQVSYAELLAILISSGVRDNSAKEIGGGILAKVGSFKGMANQPFSKFLEIKGLGMHLPENLVIQARREPELLWNFMPF